MGERWSRALHQMPGGQDSADVTAPPVSRTVPGPETPDPEIPVLKGPDNPSARSIIAVTSARRGGYGTCPEGISATRKRYPFPEPSDSPPGDGTAVTELPYEHQREASVRIQRIEPGAAIGRATGAAGYRRITRRNR